MPTYQGQLSEEQVLQLIAYIRSLGAEQGGAAGGAAAPLTGGGGPAQQRMNPLAPTTRPEGTGVGGEGGANTNAGGQGATRRQQQPTGERPASGP